MPEMEKRILENFEKSMPYMTQMEKEKLLSFGEGMAYVASKRQEGQQEPEDKGQQVTA